MYVTAASFTDRRAFFETRISISHGELYSVLSQLILCCISTDSISEHFHGRLRVLFSYCFIFSQVF